MAQQRLTQLLDTHLEHLRHGRDEPLARLAEDRLEGVVISTAMLAWTTRTAVSGLLLTAVARRRPQQHQGPTE